MYAPVRFARKLWLSSKKKIYWVYLLQIVYIFSPFLSNFCKWLNNSAPIFVFTFSVIPWSVVWQNKVTFDGIKATFISSFCSYLHWDDETYCQTRTAFLFMFLIKKKSGYWRDEVCKTHFLKVWVRLRALLAFFKLKELLELYVGPLFRIF